MKLLVNKRDENLERWSFDKLLASITKSGVNNKIAKSFAKNVGNFFMVNNGGVVKLVEIKDKVIGAIGKEEIVASSEYEVFMNE